MARWTERTFIHQQESDRFFFQKVGISIFTMKQKNYKKIRCGIQVRNRIIFISYFINLSLCQITFMAIIMFTQYASHVKKATQHNRLNMYKLITIRKYIWFFVVVVVGFHCNSTPITGYYFKSCLVFSFIDTRRSINKP